MNKIIASFSVVFLLFEISCSEQKKNINGYWISSDYSLDREFTTLYINDSTFIENPFGVYHYTNSILHADTSHTLFYPSDSGIPPIEITLKDDTLIILNWFQNRPSKYIQISSELMKTDLTFSENPISIILPDLDQYSNIDEHLFAEGLFIGKLKKGNYSKYPEVDPDSILIQLYDMFIPLNEILNVTKMAKAKVDEFDRDKIIIALYVDVETPESFLKEIKARVEESGLRTARAYKNPFENKIYFKMLN